MSVIVPNPHPNRPPKWSGLELHLRAGNMQKDRQLDEFGFKCTIGDLNRFASRYRVARSLRGITLDNYTEATQHGYSALFRLFLTWSAFEHFYRVLLGMEQSDLDTLIHAYYPSPMIAKVRRADTEDRFYTFIRQWVKHNGREQLTAYLAGERFNASYLASTVRHVFAHGILTPNAGRTDPFVVDEICNTLVSFFTHVMDKEFANRVDQGISAV